MIRTKLALIGSMALLLSTSIGVAQAAERNVPANRALTGVVMEMTPDQLPNQFRTQLRGDVKNSHGTAVLKRSGNDIAYTFTYTGMTSPVISGHFHTAPHGQVGVRGYSICGVAGESAACPSGTSGTITGVWKNADIAAFDAGNVTIAFHTQVYPAPIGEIAVYIPAATKTTASK
jgi:hypothetical protein